MSKVFFSVAMTLDGFIAPEGMDLTHADDPNFKHWLSQWSELQKWVSSSASSVKGSASSRGSTGARLPWK